MNHHLHLRGIHNLWLAAFLFIGGLLISCASFHRTEWVEEYNKHEVAIQRINETSSVGNILVNIRIRYREIAQTLWQHLLEETKDYSLFEENVRAIEWFKESSFSLLDVHDWSKDEFDNAIDFFKQAYKFHRRPGPAPPPNEFPLVKVKLGWDNVFCGVGYTPRRGRTGIWPVPNMVRMDLEALKSLIQAEAAKGWLSDAQKSSELEEIEKEQIDFEVEELNYWIEQANQDEDKYALAESLFKRGQYFAALHNFPAAIDDLKKSVVIFKGIGATKEWAINCTTLAYYYLSNNNYTDALLEINACLGPIETAKGYGKLDLLKNALSIKAIILEKMGKAEEAEHFLEQSEKKINQWFDPLIQFLLKMEATQNIPSLPQREKQVRELLANCPPDPLCLLVGQMALLQLLADQGVFEEASKLALKLRREARELWGVVKEREVLGFALTAQRARGEYAAFLKALAEYEALSRRIAGVNWMAPYESLIAHVYYSLEEYEKANNALESKEKRILRELIFKPFACWQSVENNVSDPRDLLLKARLQLATGDKDSLKGISEMTELAILWATGPDVNLKERGMDILLEAAEIHTALGNKGRALELANGVAKKVKPEEDLDLWVDATVKAGQLRIETGEAPEVDIPRIDNLVNSIREFPEFNQLNAVRLDVLLSQIYQAQKKFEDAKKHLERAKNLGDQLGNVEERIQIYRLIGGLAELEDNLPEAIRQYKASVMLLSSVSERIPSDTSKIGYREERARAIPLLVQAQYRQYIKTKDTKDIELLLEAVEQGKSHSLVEMLASRDRNMTEVSVVRLRDAMGQNEELIEYYSGLEGRVYRIHMTKQTLQVSLLNINYTDMESRLLALRDMVTPDPDFNDQLFSKAAMELASMLLPQTLLCSLDSDERVRKFIYIVPTGAMNIVPISLLKDQKNRYLDDRMDLIFSYLPSAALLLRKHEPKSQNIKSIAYINPSLDLDHHEIVSDMQDGQSRFEKAMNGWNPTEIHWEELRTPNSLMEEVQRFNNVFIYTHARFLPDRPMESYISLSPDRNGSAELNASYIATKKLKNGLWAIAGCSTGQGKIRSGDEVLGLPRALIMAGVNTVVVSLWDVMARSSAELMIDFYNALGSEPPPPPAVALQTARAQIRNAGGTLYDWAPFVIVGF